MLLQTYGRPVASRKSHCRRPAQDAGSALQGAGSCNADLCCLQVCGFEANEPGLSLLLPVAISAATRMSSPDARDLSAPFGAKETASRVMSALT